MNKQNQHRYLPDQDYYLNKLFGRQVIPNYELFDPHVDPHADNDENYFKNIFYGGSFDDIEISKQHRKTNSILEYVYEFMDKIKEKLTTQEMTFKYSISVKVVMRNSKDDEYRTFQILSTNGFQVMNIINDDELDSVIQSLESEFENIDNRLQGSGWILDSFVKIMLHMNGVNALRGNSYIKLPFKSNSIINIQNRDNMCFIWSILAQLYPVDKNPQRPTNDKLFKHIKISR